MSHIQWRTAMISIALWAAAASAQQRGEGLVREARPSDLPAAAVLSPQENDRSIARWLACDNRIILGCAKLGKERASHADVKTFADALVIEHQKCLDALESGKTKAVTRSDKHDSQDVRSGNGQANGIVKDDRNGQSRSTARSQGGGIGDNTAERERTAVFVKDDGTSRAGSAVYRPTDFVQVREDMCVRLQSVAKKEWEGIADADFDRSFMQHQVMGHEMLLASMKAVRPTATSELQTQIDEGIEKTTKHLETARKLCAEVSKPKS